ncbi:MAG: PD-(D/E)XK nuclease family protein, partial [Burkholderiaceae bacterium]
GAAAGQEGEEGEPARLLRLGREQIDAQGLPPGEFLPFWASFERFVPRYLDWLAATETEGQRYAAGEQDRSVTPFAEPELTGLRLRGRIDRIDHFDAQGQARMLIDYKTGGLTGLKAKIANPLEDTQLAVYAALVAGEAEQLTAQYLALDDSRGIAGVEHPQVQRSAALLIEGVGRDLQAAHAGAPLPALGEGQVCTFCEMRGLCRRDDWAEPAL